MKDDGRIPRIKDTDMTDRLLTAGAIAEDTRNPIGDIAACFPGHGSQSVGMFHGCLSGFPEARWIGNGVLDGFLEDESLLCEFVGAPVCEGGVESLVVGPPHIVVGVGA